MSLNLATLDTLKNVYSRFFLSRKVAGDVNESSMQFAHFGHSVCVC